MADWLDFLGRVQNLSKQRWEDPWSNVLSDRIVSSGLRGLFEEQPLLASKLLEDNRYANEKLLNELQFFSDESDYPNPLLKQAYQEAPYTTQVPLGFSREPYLETESSIGLGSLGITRDNKAYVANSPGMVNTAIHETLHTRMHPEAYPLTLWDALMGSKEKERREFALQQHAKEENTVRALDYMQGGRPKSQAKLWFKYKTDIDPDTLEGKNKIVQLAAEATKKGLFKKGP